MPLTETVSFKAVLQKGNRIQLPKLVRWRFKLETDQVLRVSVKPQDDYGSGEEFYARMDKSGRIVIPKLIRDLLGQRIGDREILPGTVMSVRLEPT